MQAYGTGPMATPEEGPLGGAHSDDENISVPSLDGADAMDLGDGDRGGGEVILDEDYRPSPSLRQGRY